MGCKTSFESISTAYAITIKVSHADPYPSRAYVSQFIEIAKTIRCQLAVTCLILCRLIDETLYLDGYCQFPQSPIEMDHAAIAQLPQNLPCALV